MGMKKFLHLEGYLIQWCRNQAGQWDNCPPPIFGSSVNPIPTGGGQIIPTYYYWPPKIFSPSGITALLLFVKFFHLFQVRPYLLATAAIQTGIQNEILEEIHKKSTVICRRTTISFPTGIRIKILEEFYTHLLGKILG